jgi:adenylate cyclase
VAQPVDDPANETGELTLAQVAAGADVSPATLRRWVQAGLIPGFDGRWTPAGAAYARVIARLRARGHRLEQIKQAGENGQLAVGPLENLLSRPGLRHSLRDAARISGLDGDMIERVYTAMGLGSLPGDGFSDEDLEILKYGAAVLEAGFPVPAFLQVMRVYGQAMAQIADAEVRLIHLYVHEPLMRAGVGSVDIATEMEGLMRDTLPFSAPFMNYLHDRLLAQFVEQDMIGHMETDLSDALGEGRVRMTIAFADLAGYARLTVERGDEAALDAVERFVEAAGEALPVDARVIKTLGDEVMVVGSDASALTRWAVDLQQSIDDAHEPPARIGIHYGEVLYRDGDYYGREVNRAARVVARAAGGEVLVTRPVVAAADGGLEFERIGEVRLKGFSEPTELFVASARAG